VDLDARRKPRAEALARVTPQLARDRLRGEPRLGPALADLVRELRAGRAVRVLDLRLDRDRLRRLALGRGEHAGGLLHEQHVEGRVEAVVLLRHAALRGAGAQRCGGREQVRQVDRLGLVVLVAHRLVDLEQVRAACARRARQPRGGS
jgi:hypothetical protein